MKLVSGAKGLFILMLLVLSGCAGPLAAFNTLVPQDAGTTVAVRDAAFGPDPRQRLDVYVPKDGRRDRKVLVFLYGGSWSSGRKQDYAFVGRAFAARGFVTVIPDYRLVPDFRYPVFVQDNAKAVAWAYANAGRYGGDRSKLYLAGHSAGAYDAAMLATAPEFLRAEGLSPKNVRAVAGLSGPYYFLPLDDPETLAAFKGVKNLPRTQPANRVGAGVAVPPMLLLHGDTDDFVRPGNSVQLAAALRRAGHEAEVRLYPGVGHRGTLLSLALPLRGESPALNDVIRFFDKH